MNNSNFILSAFILMLLVSVTSCVSTKDIVKKEDYSDNTNSELVYSQVKPGDIVTIKAHDRFYRNLEVISVNDSYLIVQYFTVDHRKLQHKVNSKYIQSLSIVKTEITYPIGGPFTVLLIIMFLLV